MSREDNIFSEIKFILSDHELPYEKGAYESFLQHQKKSDKKRLLFFLTLGTTTAASIIIFLITSIAPIELNRKTSLHNINKVHINDTQSTTRDSFILLNPISPLSYEEFDLKVQACKLHTIYPLSTSQNSIILSQLNDSTSDLNNAIKTYKDSINKASDFTQSKQTIPAIKRSFKFEVQASATVANSLNANFGFTGGLNLNYELNDHITFNSGVHIGYQKLDKRWIKPNTTNNQTQIHNKLTTFEIPLNVKLKFKRGSQTYLLAGITNQTYLEENITKITRYTETVGRLIEVDGKEEIRYTEETYEKDENVQLGSFNSFDFAGFANLAYGIEYNLTTEIGLTIQPYIKIPLSKISTSKLKYNVSGVSIIIRPR